MPACRAAADRGWRGGSAAQPGWGGGGAAGERRRDVYDGGAFTSSSTCVGSVYCDQGKQEQALEAHRMVLEIKLKMARSAS